MDVITANSLGDGAVVFRTASGGWSRRIEDAEILDGKEPSAAALAAAEADAAQNIVVEPYAVAVGTEAGHIVPAKLRERIRAEGPTTGSSKKMANSPPPRGEGSSAHTVISAGPSPSRVAATLAPQGGEGSRP